MTTTLIKLNVHNAFKECDEHIAPRYEKATVKAEMVPLLDKLSRKNPSWEFYSSNYGSTDANGNYCFSRFDIKDFGEELGWIDYEIHWRDPALNTYLFNGPRLEAKRSRGHASKARNVDKAAKLICANISTMTLTERMGKARSKANETASSVYGKHYYRYRNLRDKLSDNFATFVLARWEEFTAHIAGDRFASDAATLPDDYALMLSTARLKEAYNIDQGAVVLMHRDDYHVTYDSARDTVHSYKLDDVPADIKTGVALLKLVEVGKHIDDVGVRAEDGLFYVIKGDA
jgi:hypothetical protein